MRKGYRVTLGVLTIMILMTLTVGTSYSYYSVSDTQTDPNELTTTCFDISFTDSNSVSLNSDGLYAYPMTEEVALSKYTPYEFTITNKCTSENASSGVNYVITLNTLTQTPSTLTNYVKYKLNTTSPAVSEKASSFINATPYDLSSTIKTEQDIDSSYSLDVGALAPGEHKTYNLYLWIDENAGNEVMGYTFNGKILVYAYM